MYLSLFIWCFSWLCSVYCYNDWWKCYCACNSTQLNLASITTSSSKDNLCSSDDDSDVDEETATKELAAWRSAVALATSSAQLCLYMMQLNKCIAWEKSIMKVVSMQALFIFVLKLWYYRECCCPKLQTLICLLLINYCYIKWNQFMICIILIFKLMILVFWLKLLFPI